MWGHNAYFGYDTHCYFEYYDRVTAKPLVVTEYGIDAYDMTVGMEYKNLQAAWSSACVPVVRRGHTHSLGMGPGSDGAVVAGSGKRRRRSQVSIGATRRPAPVGTYCNRQARREPGRRLIEVNGARRVIMRQEGSHSWRL